MLLLEEGRYTMPVDATSSACQTDLIHQFACFEWVVFSFSVLVQRQPIMCRVCLSRFGL